jgi:hypothetical protein
VALLTMTLTPELLVYDVVIMLVGVDGDVVSE